LWLAGVTYTALDDFNAIALRNSMLARHIQSHQVLPYYNNNTL